MNTLNFFSEYGLTSTSANHIANLAKERVRSVQSTLNSMEFVDHYVSIIGVPESTPISAGWNATALSKVQEMVEEVALAHSLIAFLREAIKEKDRCIAKAKAYTDKDTEERILWQEKVRELNSSLPAKEPYPTEETIKQGWSVGEQEKYLSLEAKASAIGKLIFPDGALNVARLDLLNRLNKPSTVNYSGRDTIIHMYTPSVSKTDVDNVFNSLQALHRTTQAELNGMKKKIEDTIFEEKLRIDSEYAAKKREWDEAYTELEKQGHRLDEKESEVRDNLIREATSLKIVVPNRYKDYVKVLQETATAE